jgi:hypothetical protein
MASRTVALLGSLPAATARTVMSRSVTTPTSRSLSPTGRTPKSPSRISAAASLRLMPGLASLTSVLITSLTCMAHLPFTVQAR